MRDVTCFKYENGEKVQANVDPESAAKAYKEYVEKNIRTFDLRVEFGKKELLTNDIVSIRINSDLFSTDSFTIGSVVAETLELTIFTDTVFGTEDIDYIENWIISKKSPIVPYVALRTEVEVETAYGFELQEIWQEVCLGPFFINPDGINEDGIGVMSIRASSLFTHPDYSNKTFYESTSDSEKDLYRIINNIENFGSPSITVNPLYNQDTNPYFTLKNDDLPDISIQQKSDSISGKTVRAIIEHIAKLYGGYARTIYKDGRVWLEFIRLTPTDYVYDESSYVNLTRGGAGTGLRISCIKCRTGKNAISAGSGSPTMHTVHMECADMTQEQLSLILSKYNGLYFRPTTTKIFGNPLLEVGDVATIKGRGIKSDGAKLPLHSVVYNITGSGVTMDIKALYKIADVAKYVTEKAKEDKEKENQNEKENEEQNFKDAIQQDLDELYDRTTIQYEDKDKNLPLITIKEDYLESKQSLNTLSNNYTSLNKKLEDHLSRPEDVNQYLNPLNFYEDDELIAKIGTNTHKSGNSDTESTQQLYLSLMQEKDMLNIDNCIITTGRPDGVGHDGHHCFQGLNLLNPHIVPHGQGGTTMTLTAWMETYLDSYGNCIGSGELSVGTYSNFYVSGGYELSLCLHGRTNQYSDHSYNIAMKFYAKNYNPSDIGMDLNVDTDATDHTVSNVYIANTVSSQSEYTANLINSGTNENIMHGSLSYDSGELRWCHKENVFTYAESEIDPETDQWVYTGRYICYVELPIFMAENIQNDYHINVSKMSWGDYRIIEKNPYYFILESQEDNFAFTFEVVAKLNDNQTLDANASIAGYSYRHYDKNSEQEQE